MSVTTHSAGPVPTRRVLLVEDHAATVTAVAGLIDQLRPEIGVVGMARDLVSAKTAIRETMPDIVVLDLDLGGENGLELLPTLAPEQRPSVVVLSVSDDTATRNRAFAAGAGAFVSKLASAEELLSAIQAGQPNLKVSAPGSRCWPGDGTGKG
jgi:two-component system, NarL family, nitrate/nitrite response regulator NarL